MTITEYEKLEDEINDFYNCVPSLTKLAQQKDNSSDLEQVTPTPLSIEDIEEIVELGWGR